MDMQLRKFLRIICTSCRSFFSDAIFFERLLHVTVLNDGSERDAMIGKALVYHLGELLDRQCQVEELVGVDICEADFRLAQAEQNVAG